MDESSERYKLKGKAKVEETDEDSLPPKSTSNTNVDHYYLKLYGDLRTQDAIGPKALEGVTRNLFRIRNKDILSDVKLQQIHKDTGATIGLYSDPEVRADRHTYLELLGTVIEVKIAEVLTEDAITEKYEKPNVPTALMPTSLCHNRMPIPLPKVSRLLGFFGSNILDMEAKSGAWIELGTKDLLSAGGQCVKEVVIFGSSLQVTNATNMIDKIVSEETVIPTLIWDPDTPEDVWDILADGMMSFPEGEQQEFEAAMLEGENMPEDSVEETARNDSVQEITSTAESEHREAATLEGENKQDASVEQTAHNDSVKEADAEDNRSDQKSATLEGENKQDSSVEQTAHNDSDQLG